MFSTDLITKRCENGGRTCKISKDIVRIFGSFCLFFWSKKCEKKGEKGWKKGGKCTDKMQKNAKKLKI